MVPVTAAETRPPEDNCSGTHTLRIVQLITGSELIGGAETHVRHLVRELTSDGHDCTVLAGPPNPAFYKELREAGIAVHIIDSLRKAIVPWRDCLALADIVTHLRRLKPDIVAAHTAKACFLGRLAAALVGIPCVCTPHGCSVLDRKTGRTCRLFLTLERIAGPLTHKLITVSNQERILAEASKIVRLDRIVAIHNGIPDTPDVADPGRDPAVITMIARFDPPKDHMTLLRAMAILRGSPWVLRLAGSGKLLDTNRRLATELGIGGRVQFLGECTDIARLLSESQIFVLSSRLEAFPISILEAMRAGLPVVAASVGGVPEAICDQETGLLFPACDHLALAERLRVLIEKPNLRQALGKSARASYLARFTADRMGQATLGIYKEVLQSRLANTGVVRPRYTVGLADHKT